MANRSHYDDYLATADAAERDAIAEQIIEDWMTGKRVALPPEIGQLAAHWWYRGQKRKNTPGTANTESTRLSLARLNTSTGAGVRNSVVDLKEAK